MRHIRFVFRQADDLDVAYNANPVRIAKIRRLRDSRMLYGTVIRQSDNVMFLRMTSLQRVKKGEDFMVGLSGHPEMICIARLLDEPPTAAGAGATLRFGLLTDMCPIGLL